MSQSADKRGTGREGTHPSGPLPAQPGEIRGVRNYCPLCKTSFKTNVAKQEHMRIVHG